jgi:hypothetical protein
LITMRQRPLENTRTPERSSFFEAECEVDGRRYAARSRRGAPNELARVLVSAGVADQPVAVRHAGIKGCISYRSLHELALWTYEESATVPLRRVRWKPSHDFIAAVRGRIAQNRGATPAPVGEEPEPVLSMLEERDRRRDDGGLRGADGGRTSPRPPRNGKSAGSPRKSSASSRSSPTSSPCRPKSAPAPSTASWKSAMPSSGVSSLYCAYTAVSAQG